MICWAVIPIKVSSSAKSRLAGVLGAAQRQELVADMLGRVIRAAQGADRIGRTCLVGASRLGQPETVPLLADPGQGLNAAVQSALGQVMADANPPDRLIVVAADLPQVTVHELNLMALAPAGSVAIAPDRHETGTNALSLPLPAAQGFQFAFGEDSFARHKAEAQRLGLEIEEIVSRGLERDVDEPSDLAEANAALDKT